MTSEEIRIYAYKYPFKTVTDVKKLQNYDRYTVDSINRLQAAIEELKSYRTELFNHTQKLINSAYSIEVSIERYKHYYGKVNYYVKVAKVFENIGHEYIISEIYQGTERYTALKRFEELKKQYPGANYIKNIEKSKWER